ncbi:hypothetical protein BH11PLA1_BH11PLA1_05530 [soil metagenome]
MRWMWIDRVIELKPRERLVALKNVSMAEEHLSDHFPADAARGLDALPIMPACFILEGLAQSGGILVGHAHDFKHKVILAKVNRASLETDATAGDTLRYTARVQRIDDLSATIAAEVEVLRHSDPVPRWRAMGSAEMMFSHLDNNMGGAGAAGTDFPAHNFVFGESFKTLLRTSGF